MGDLESPARLEPSAPLACRVTEVTQDLPDYRDPKALLESLALAPLERWAPLEDRDPRDPQALLDSKAKKDFRGSPAPARKAPKATKVLRGCLVSPASWGPLAFLASRAHQGFPDFQAPKERWVSWGPRGSRASRAYRAPRDCPA